MADVTPELPFEPIIQNPIGWAQLRLSGGIRRLLLLGLIYAVAILTLHLIIYRAAREAVPLPKFCASAMTIMLVVSVTTLFILGTGAIKKAIQRDFTSDMISSHRLSGMSGFTAVMGYLTGPTAQALTLTFINWLTCTILAMFGALSPGQSKLAPTIIFVIMGCFTLFCWSATILAALATRGAFAVTGLIVAFAFAFNSEVLQLVPGLSLLFGSFSIVRISAGAFIKDMSLYVLTAMLAQLLFSIIFIIAAARKYHRDDVIAFTPMLDYAWILLFSVLSVGGLRYNETRLLGANGPDELRIALVATCAFLALMAYLPVANAAKRSAEWRWRMRRDPARALPPPGDFIFASIMCCLIVYCVLMGGLAPFRNQLEFRAGARTITSSPIAQSTAAFLLTLITFGALIRFVYSITPRGLFAVILIIFFLWLAPLLGDLTIEAMQASGFSSPVERSLLFASSPIGTWVCAFRGISGPIMTGLGIQAAVAIAAFVLSRRAK